MLSLILLLDQFPRNMYRNQALMYSGDPVALDLSHQLADKGWDTQLLPIERLFAYLPFEHSEKPSDQTLSIEHYVQLVKDADEADKTIFETCLDYAHRHKMVIDRFGRYPYRNPVLGRVSTPEELEYMVKGGENFIIPDENKSAV